MVAQMLDDAPVSDLARGWRVMESPQTDDPEPPPGVSGTSAPRVGPGEFLGFIWFSLQQRAGWGVAWG